ncbi:carbohydrate-binding domain-containing protein [Winogradskya humida]|uniref:Carbohydrate-binding domain-containing protein n=1 Tax=Winogradskya humida TaxID=113566 RepID=A0ABQ4A0G1_9ACTN|nr:carbohydrate-binding domain-containing protein [Actinoplanes humidus]GIE23827.1 hypothetical protein Ahu01nite_069290 [Actinoplanes humidus]
MRDLREPAPGRRRRPRRHRPAHLRELIAAVSSAVLAAAALTARTDDKDSDTPPTAQTSAAATVDAGQDAATVLAANKAVHSDGSVHLHGVALTAASGDDGVHAEDALRIDAGRVTITGSNEGLEAAHIAVAGGTASVTSSDDGVNGSGESEGDSEGGGGGEQVGDFDVTVSGGTLIINADGDGLDSNGTASITGGTVVVNGPTERNNGALDVNGAFTISGGILIAAGSSGMPVAPGTDSTQAWLSATLASTVPAGTTLYVTDANGKPLATFVTSKDMQNLVYSSSTLTKDGKYTIYSGGKASGTSTGGLSASGTLGSAKKLTTVTAGVAPEGGFGGRRPGR